MSHNKCCNEFELTHIAEGKYGFKMGNKQNYCPFCGVKKQTKEKIYISGKISGLEEKDYTRKFLNSNYCLKKLGYNVVNPLQIKPFLGLKTWHCYMIADLWELLNCDAIYMQKDWHNSRGAKIEHKVAKWLRIKRIYQN